MHGSRICSGGPGSPDQGIELHTPIGFGDQLNHHDFLERAMGIEIAFRKSKSRFWKALPPLQKSIGAKWCQPRVLAVLHTRFLSRPGGGFLLLRRGNRAESFQIKPSTSR